MGNTSPSYDILVTGNSLKLGVGYLGMSNCTLIHTADGPILFDVGGWVTRDMIRAGLERFGLTPKDISRVFLSHLHNDHVLNIDMFSYSTRVFVSRAEWDYVSNPNPKDDWIPWGVQDQLKKYNLTLLDDGQELSAGVRCFPVPGHTPGCYAVSLTIADGTTATLAGDAIKFPKEALRCWVDHAFDTQEIAAKSIKTIVEMSDVIVPGHFCPIQKRDGELTWDDSQEIALVIR